MARYTSSRGSSFLKIASLVLAIVGVVSFTNIWHALRRLGHGMGHNPIPTTILILGVLLAGYAFREEILGWLGWMSPRRAERLIKEWLETQSYSIKVERKAPGFVIVGTDNVGHKIGISWATEPYVGVYMQVTWNVGAEMADVWAGATPADLRELKTRLMDLGARFALGTTMTDLDDATKAAVNYFALLPRDLVNYEDFFQKVNELVGSGIVALNHLVDLHATLKERQDGITQP